MRLLMGLSLLASFGLALTLVLLGLVDSVYLTEKLTPAIARGDIRHVFHSLSHLAILVVMSGALFAGGMYLPVCWLSQRRVSAWSGIPRGERLWFAAGTGMLLAVLFDTSGLLDTDKGYILIPSAGMLVAVCTFGVYRREPDGGPKARYNNLLGWLVSCAWSVVLSPGSVFILIESLSIDR